MGVPREAQLGLVEYFCRVHSPAANFFKARPAVAIESR